MNIAFLSATGNRFALIDGFAGDWPDDPASAARELCKGGVLDGLLLVGRPVAGGACRMQVWNADGSRAEMCGNGMRCVGRFVVEHGHVAAEEFDIESDVGRRSIKLLRKPNDQWSARVELGVPRHVETRDVAVEGPGAARTWRESAVLVDLGNPHCVFFVDDPASAPVAEVGAALQAHAEFPHGTNVEFAAPSGHQLAMRVWERGVGETASCGSGACAAALAAILQGRVRSPVEVSIPGGWLLVERDERGVLWLTGSIERIDDPRAQVRA
jgi:diaminopimelate epimerase